MSGRWPAPSPTRRCCSTPCSTAMPRRGSAAGRAGGVTLARRAGAVLPRQARRRGTRGLFDAARAALERAGHSRRATSRSRTPSGRPTSTCTSSCRKRRGITRRCSRHTPTSTRQACGCGSRWGVTSWRRTTCARCTRERSCGAAVDRALEGLDALLLPALAIGAPLIGAAIGHDRRPRGASASDHAAADAAVQHHRPSGDRDSVRSWVPTGCRAASSSSATAARHRAPARSRRRIGASDNRSRRVGRRRRRLNLRTARLPSCFSSGSGGVMSPGLLTTSGTLGTSGLGGCSIMARDVQPGSHHGDRNGGLKHTKLR